MNRNEGRPKFWKLARAAVSLGFLAVCTVVLTTQPLFSLTTEASLTAELSCNLHAATLTARGQTITKRSVLPCYDMLIYEFDSYSFFYVGEEMETLIGLAFALIWATLGSLACSTLVLFLALRYKSLNDAVACLFAGIAAFLSLVALVAMAQATGESKVAKRYDYSQTPSVKVTGWLPLFPLLQFVIIWHFADLVHPKQVSDKTKSWVSKLQRKLGLAGKL